MDELKTLEPGSYFDDNEMLHGPDGSLLPDGVYRDPDGSIFMYEGNEAARLAEMQKAFSSRA